MPDAVPRVRGVFDGKGGKASVIVDVLVRVESERFCTNMVIVCHSKPMAVNSATLLVSCRHEQKSGPARILAFGCETCQCDGRCPPDVDLGLRGYHFFLVFPSIWQHEVCLNFKNRQNACDEERGSPAAQGDPVWCRFQWTVWKEALRLRKGNYC